MTLPNAKRLSLAAAFAVAAAALLLATPGLTRAQVTPGGVEDETEEPYALADIEHAFAAMEPYVTYDEKKNISFDLDAAGNDPDVSSRDINIALDFAGHSNEIMDAAAGPTGQVDELEQTRDERVAQAVDDLENGRFSELFDNGTGSTGSVNDPMQVPVSPAMWTGESGDDIHQTKHSRGGSTLACGGSFSQPHPAAKHTTTGNFASHGSAVINLIVKGYHQAPPLVSLNYPNDYAKVVDAYNCNNGPFRTQSIVGYTGSYYYHSNHDVEPNPELYKYVWPKLWWGSYVHWWHVNF